MSQRDVKEILLGTANGGKLTELNKLLGGLPIKLKNLGEFPDIIEVTEDGTTFEENASLKAAGYAQQTGLYTLADDSGLEVTALGNRPGAHSARYGGSDTGCDEKIQKLLEELADTKSPDRSARFVCVMSLADAAGKIVFNARGICSGKIAAKPAGTNGFGYDPIFIPDEFNDTFGVLGDDIKQQISHRGRASAEIIRYLQGFFAV